MVKKAKAGPRIDAPLDGWAAAWASDTVIAAHSAFEGLSFTGTSVHKWSVQFDDRKAYVRVENRLKQEQIAKGGARLSDLLNAIWP